MGIPAEVTERVALGAAWLDENRPGWVDEVDEVVLALDNRCQCVLGQLYADPADPEWGLCGALSGYDYALDVVAPGDRDFRWALGHGFLAETDGEYPDLTAAWRDLILDRRAAGS